MRVLLEPKVCSEASANKESAREVRINTDDGVRAPRVPDVKRTKV